MSEITGILSAVLAGVLLGVASSLAAFGGPSRKTLSSTQAGLWFSGSFLVRTAVVLVGFYFVGQGDWRRITGCIAGFLGARLCVVRATRLKEGS